MPQFDRSEMDAAARRFGFTRDTFEKVVRLKEILAWISEQDILKNHLLLNCSPLMAKEAVPTFT